MQHLVTRMQNPELFLHESVALEMVLQVTPSPEEPFQEPLTQGLTPYVARILRIYDKWQLLQIRLSCIHMTNCSIPKPAEVFCIQVVSEKIIQFSIFYCRKSKQSTAKHSSGQKHNFPVCKKIFKWYHSMVRCKSYGPLSDEW